VPRQCRNTTGAETHLERKWSPVNQRTELASGQILDGVVLNIWLVRPADKPESVVVMWPQQPTTVSPRHYSELAATVCRLVANASTELAAIKAGKQTQS
jgi:hypothetical protein